MRKDFCAFILTHGRPDRVYTYDTIQRCGYTGDIYLVVDDEDKTLPKYQEKFGEDNVLVFSKAEIAKTFDEGDNFRDRRTIVYARNVTFELAEKLGYKYFIQLDDDYTGFEHRFDENREYGYWYMRNLDAILEAMVDFLVETPFLTVAIAQGGDHIGGGASKKVVGTKRKAMNTFVCSTDKPFQFVGRVNEDVNTYTSLQRRGGCFLTTLACKIKQMDSQTNAGGMTELYLDSGTYVKSFYSVMYCPSSVVVAPLRDFQKTEEVKDGNRGGRIHHKVKWNQTAPMIVPESYKKYAKERK